MAFDVSALTTYVEENSVDLMTSTVLGARTMNYVEVVPNVKGDHKLPAVTNSVFFQTDSCGFDASGASTFSQRTLSPGKMKLNVEWCPKDLETKYFAAQMKAGSHKETVEPEDVFQIILADYMALVSREIEIAMWQGNASSGTGNNQFFNGFIAAIAAGGIDANATTIYDASALTSVTAAASAPEVAYRMYEAMAKNGLSGYDDSVVFVGYDTFAAVVNGLTAGGSTFGPINNGPNGNVNPDISEGLTFPGNGLRMVPVHGLTGTSDVYGGRQSNFFVGVDGEQGGDFESMEIWYSKDERKVRMAMEFKCATQVGVVGDVAHIIL
tara:strand:+ start:2103 stop:3077 length:975 start_codon:yes stop_codon:yes gene_type:complete